jgi:hypothetical protein
MAPIWSGTMPDVFSGEELLQLRDFLLDRLNDGEFRQNLSRLGIRAENLWDASGSNRERYFSLLDLANRHRWCKLLAFCVLSDFYDDGLAGSLLTEYERAGLQLFRILEDQRVPTDEVVRCYFDAKPADWDFSPPEKAAAGRMFAAYSIAKSQEHAAQSRPLCDFTQGIAACFNKDGNHGGLRSLGAWWERTARDLRLGDDNLIVPAARGRERYSVIVEIRETDTSTPQKPRWMRRAWVFTHGAQRFDELDSDDLGKTETPETISAYLSGLRERLARRRIPADAVLFEFFVSRTSLSLAIDQWTIQVDDEIQSEIGYESPVVIRDLDRKLPTRDKVKPRWERLSQVDHLTVSDGSNDEPHTVLEAAPGGDLNDLYKRFDRSTHLLCLLLTEPFVQRDDIQRLPCLKAALAAGVPMIIWVRCRCAVAALVTSAQQWFCKPPSTLPQRIHDFRRTRPQADLNHLGRHVTLLLEDGDHWFPDDDPLAEARDE